MRAGVASLKHISMSTCDYPITDENGLLRRLQLKVYPDKPVIKARLHSLYAQQSQLVKNILPLLSISAGDNPFVPSADEFDIPIVGGAPQSLKINGQRFADFAVGDGKITDISKRKLSVFETRMIGRSAQTGYPRPLDANAIQMPITDLHTHLSAQISAEDLMELGKSRGVLYPTKALDMLGIDYSKADLQYIPKRIFLPWAHLETSKEPTEPAKCRFPRFPMARWKN